MQSTTEEDQLQLVYGKTNKSPPKEAKKEAELTKPIKGKKAPAEEKSFVNDLKAKTDASIWENLKPEDGVVIVEQGQKKFGRKYTSMSVSNSAVDLQNLPVNPNDIVGKISVAEYKKRIRNGNLSREPSKVNLEESGTDNKMLAETINYEIVNPQASKPSKPHRVRSIDMRMLPNTNGMRVHSSKLLENLLKVEMEPMFPKKPAEISHLATVLDNVPRITNIDQFNLKIITTKEWGMNIPMPSTATPLSFTQLKHKNFKATLGEMFKPPRARTYLNSNLTSNQYLNTSSSNLYKGSQSPPHSINSISNLTLTK